MPRSSGTRLLLRHDGHGWPQKRRDRSSIVCGIESHDVLDEHEAKNVVEVVPVDREPGILLLAEQRTRSPMVAVSLRATMSGRGVMTSRTMVSLKSTMLRKRRRPSPSMIPLASCVSWNVAAASWVACSVSSCTGRWLRRPLIDRAVHRAIGPRALAIGLNEGSKTSNTRSGSRPTMSSGSKVRTRQ